MFIYHLLVCPDVIQIRGCTSSTQYSAMNSCEMAFDTDLYADSTDWATHNEGVGAWIQLDFQETYEIESLEIRHRSQVPAMRFEEIKLEFSNEQSYDYTLNDDPMISNKVVFLKLMISAFLRITTTSTYGTLDNGYSDIKIWGCLVGN